MQQHVWCTVFVCVCVWVNLHRGEEDCTKEQQCQCVCVYVCVCGSLSVGCTCRCGCWDKAFSCCPFIQFLLELLPYHLEDLSTKEAGCLSSFVSGCGSNTTTLAQCIGLASLILRCSVKLERSAWYPRFTHARAALLRSPYNSLGCIY